MHKKTTYRKCKSKSLFEQEITQESLKKMGNPLEALSQLIDFEMFRPTLEDALLTKECKSMSGAKPIDVVQLFKVLLIKRYYDLSDFQTESY